MCYEINRQHSTETERGGRDRQTDRDRERERQTETDRQTETHRQKKDRETEQTARGDRNEKASPVPKT